MQERKGQEPGRMLKGREKGYQVHTRIVSDLQF